MRFYLQHKQDPHGPNIALFIGNLPQALSQRNYETIITKYITEENKYSSIGPIYYEYGSVIITFENASKAVSDTIPAANSQQSFKLTKSIKKNDFRFEHFIA